MKWGIIELDRKGILPRVNENESSFYEGGNRFLETVYEFKEKSSREMSMKEKFEDFEKHFLTYPDWVSCSYQQIKQSKNKGIILGRTQLVKYRRREIPIIFLEKSFSETSQEVPRVEWYKETILRHELTHAVRTRLEQKQKIREFFSPVNNLGNTREAFAYSLDFAGEYPKIISQENVGRYVFEVLFSGFSFWNFLEEDILFGIAWGILAGINLNSIIKGEKSIINSALLYKSLENIKERGHLEQNPELGYALLRMTGSDVRSFEKTLEETRYSKKLLEQYVKSKSSEGLRFRLIAERLG